MGEMYFICNMKLAIYIGTFYTAPLFTDQVGGSEIMAIQLGETLLKRHIATRVVIYGALQPQDNCRITTGGVECRMWTNMMLDTENFDILIVSRFLYAFYLYDLTRFGKILYWIHDVHYHDCAVIHDKKTNDLLATKYDKYGFPAFHAIEHRIEKVVFVSQWQMDNLRQIATYISEPMVDAKKMCIIPNAIPDELFEYDIMQKKSHSFILTTDPMRAMPNIIKMWPFIRQHFPDATLNIYYYGHVSVDMLNTIATYKNDGITWCGKSHPSDIYIHISKAQYYLYPLIGHETFGLSTVQASALGCHVIATDFSGVGETGHNIGSYLVDRQMDMNTYAHHVVEYMKKVDAAGGIINHVQQCRQRTRELYSFKNVIDKWAHLLHQMNLTRSI